LYKIDSARLAKCPLDWCKNIVIYKLIFEIIPYTVF